MQYICHVHANDGVILVCACGVFSSLKVEKFHLVDMPTVLYGRENTEM